MESFFQQLGNQFALGEGLNVGRIGVTLALAFALGIYIFFIYKKTFAGVMYSRNYNVSLIMMTMVTAMIIMPITQNLTLSLGMVGALSIVRFRTAVKDPVDTMFMFWAIAAGIMMGASFYVPGVLATLIVGLLVYLISFTKLRISAPYLLVLHFDADAANAVKGVMKQLPSANLKSQTVTPAGVELTLEMRLKNPDPTLVNKFMQVPGVNHAALISYSGDIVS